MPGRPDAVTISVTGDTVTISGEVSHEEHDTKGRTYIEEIWAGSFQRSFTLPFPVNVDNADASFENGMLKLTLPKSEAARPRNVRVSSGRSKSQRTIQAQSQQTQKSSDGEVQRERVPAGTAGTSGSSGTKS